MVPKSGQHTAIRRLRTGVRTPRTGQRRAPVSTPGMDGERPPGPVELRPSTPHRPMGAPRAQGSTTPGRPKEGGMTVRRTAAARRRGIGGSVGDRRATGGAGTDRDSARGGGLWVGSGGGGDTAARRRVGRRSPTHLLPTAGTVSGHDTTTQRHDDATTYTSATARRCSRAMTRQRNNASMRRHDHAQRRRTRLSREATRSDRANGPSTAPGSTSDGRSAVGCRTRGVAHRFA